MSEVALDALATIPADAPLDTARDHAAALVRGGISLEDANRALASRNAAPLTANSKEMAEQSRANLLNDSDFVQRYGRGDPKAVAELFQADLRVQQSTGKLLDRGMASTDYSLKVAPHLPADTEPGRVETYSNDLATLASALNMPKENAQSLTDAHFRAIKETAVMTKDEQTMWAQGQTAMLHKALGADAENQIAAATATLAKTGRTLNIADIVKSNGAEAALILVHQAQVLARQKR